MTRWPDWKLKEALARRTVPGENGCLLFTGHRDKQGYARIYDGTEKRLVHRVAHELFIGPIPDGYQVDHVLERGCAHRHCVNPAHLEAVTALVNTRRAARGNARKTHCDHGHAFTRANTRIVTRPDGGKCRACRKCDTARARVYRARRSSHRAKQAA